MNRQDRLTAQDAGGDSIEQSNYWSANKVEHDEKFNS